MIFKIFPASHGAQISVVLFTVQPNGFSILTSALSGAWRLRQARGLLSWATCLTYLIVVFPYWWKVTDTSELPLGTTGFLCRFQLGLVLSGN